MMHKPAHKDTVNPPGQIVNFEKPLVENIKDYKKAQEGPQIDAQAREIEQLRGRVLELEKELDWWDRMDRGQC
jgi:hypothetical protein